MPFGGTAHSWNIPNAPFEKSYRLHKLRSRTRASEGDFGAMPDSLDRGCVERARRAARTYDRIQRYSEPRVSVRCRTTA